MKKLFVLLVIAGLVVGFGFYRGWFRADKDRIKEDEHTAIEKAREVGGKVTEGVQKGVDKLREGTQK
jgi:hypothetical protein